MRFSQSLVMTVMLFIVTCRSVLTVSVVLVLAMSSREWMCWWTILLTVVTLWCQQVIIFWRTQSVLAVVNATCCALLVLSLSRVTFLVWSKLWELVRWWFCRQLLLHVLLLLRTMVVSLVRFQQERWWLALRLLVSSTFLILISELIWRLWKREQNCWSVSKTRVLSPCSLHAVLDGLTWPKSVIRNWSPISPAAVLLTWWWEPQWRLTGPRRWTWNQRTSI